MDSFSLAYTSTTGACVDTFAVTVGSSRDYPNLCGTLTGDHMYLETGRATTAQTLAFTIAATTGSATYKIKVSQIECYNTNRAPDDCFQYFTGRSGRVKSLNRSNSRMLQNMRYTACIRRESGTCGIHWAPTTTTEYSPSDSYDIGNSASAVVGSSAAALTAVIIIPGTLGTTYSGQTFADTAAVTSDSSTTGNS